jgi:hypothetical protein
LGYELPLYFFFISLHIWDIHLIQILIINYGTFICTLKYFIIGVYFVHKSFGNWIVFIFRLSKK